MDTDASNNGIETVSTQIHDGKKGVVLPKSEKIYCVTRKELLAIVNAVSHFYKYLYGRHLEQIRTDHAALK